VIHTLWASVVENPERFKKINGWLTIFWIAMVPVSILAGWVQSVEYVSALSIYALITGHLSTWQAARVEVKQEQQDNSSDEVLHDKVDEVRAKLPDN
jgi:hypothetical protein